MTPARRRAALRVGGVVITASLLLAVERCAREPDRPTNGDAETTRRLPVDRSVPIFTPDHAPRPSAAPPVPPPIGRMPTAGRQPDRSLHGLVGPIPPRAGPSLVAANDQAAAPPAAWPAAPAPTPAPAPGQAPGADAPSGSTSLHGITGAVRPRDPLLGLASGTTPAMAEPSDQPPAPPLPATANDNPGLPPVAGTASAPPPMADGPSVAAMDTSQAQPAAAPPQRQPAAEARQNNPAPAKVPVAASAEPQVPGGPQVPAGQAQADAPTVPAPPGPPMVTPANPVAAPSPVPSPDPVRAVDGPKAPTGLAGTVPPLPSPAAAAEPPASPRTSGIGPAAKPLAGFSDDDELILEITTARHELNGTIIAYTQRGIPYLPLGEIARFLDLAVTVGDDGRYASGWAIDPTKTVTINLREGTITIDGQTRKLAPDDAVAFDGELYLRADRFADLFPLTLTTNLRAQSVTVQTRVPFPFEQRLARENARDLLKSRQGRRDGRSFTRVATPWRMAEVPLVDTELRLASDTTRGPRAETDLRLAGDLAWLTARAFLSADSRNGLTSARLELGRRDPDGSLLGPLGATAFGLGDVTSTPLAMGPASVAGRGFYLGNASLERASVFDRIELRGDLPDGYEAELYRNNILIDTASGPDNGQYRFLNVPVEFGLNVFRVVLYGPQGQRRETVRQISVGDGRLSTGELVYTASAVQKNRSLFNLQGRDYIAGPDDGALRATADVQYGFSGGLTGTLGTAWYERFGTRHWLATTGLRTGLAGFAVRLDGGLADGGGRALGLGLARKLAGFSVTLNHAEYRGGFVDEVRSYSDQPLRRLTELAFNGAIRIGGEGSSFILPTNGLVRHVAFADGRRVLSAAVNQTVPLSRALQLSNLVEFNRTSQPLFGTTTQLRGAFDLASLSRGKTQLRASLGYTLFPHAAISTAAVQIDRRIGERMTLSASAGHAFEAGQDRFGLSAIRRFDRFSVAFDAAYSTRPSQYSAMLRLSVSLGRNPLDGRLFLSQPGLASGGAVALHAFRDLDGDGRPGPGEPPLGEVRFFAGNESRATDAAGNVLLGRLGDGPRTSVRIDGDSLPDINLAPAVEGIEFAPRAGHIHVQPFPVRALGALDGMAFYQTPGGEKGVSGVIVLLVGPDGKQAGRTRTGSDGAFWFEKVVPGAYSVQLDPGQANRLKVRLSQPVSVEIGSDGEGQRAELHLLGAQGAEETP